MIQFLSEASTCGVARKVLFECAFEVFNSEYFYVHQYTLTYEVCGLTIPQIGVSYELKRDEAVLKGVDGVPHTMEMSARQAIEAMVHESQHNRKTFPKDYSDVYYYFSL